MAASAMRPFVVAADAVNDNFVHELRRIGIDFSAQDLRDMHAAMAMDAAPNAQATTYANSIPVPTQFLQTFLPGFVQLVTQVRNIDELVGKMTVGAWEDEEIVQGAMEPTGFAQLYGDYTNIPLASWNLSWERRTIVRFEEGMRVGVLENARVSKIKVADAARKRSAAALALDIQRNRVGFYGFNGGAQRTYGFLNDPNLPAYVNVAGGTWSAKTFLQITADIRTAWGALILSGGGLIKKDSKATLALPLGADNWLSVTSDFGNSVNQWLRETYPNMRIVSAPELTAANGGASVFYLYADSVQDGDSDDGGQTFVQMVPTSFKTIGVEAKAKAYVEDYSNATAGVMVKRPFAVVRYSGI